MNQGQARIPCPKCRSNNFLGQTNCWQCGSSLPPPEAFAAAQPSAMPPPQSQPQFAPGSRHSSERPAPFPQTPAPQRQSAPYVPTQRGGRSRWLIAYYAVFGFSVLMLLVYMGFYGKVRRDAMAID